MSSDDSALEAHECLEALHTLRALFQNGAIWSDAAEGTLTHTVLKSIKNKAVFISGARGRDEVILMGWPAPETRERQRPIERAKRFYQVFEAFMQSHFPNYDTGHLLGLFDLSSPLTHRDRLNMLQGLCSRCEEHCFPCATTRQAREVYGNGLNIFCCSPHVGHCRRK